MPKVVKKSKKVKKSSAKKAVKVAKLSKKSPVSKKKVAKKTVKKTLKKAVKKAVKAVKKTVKKTAKKAAKKTMKKTVKKVVKKTVKKVAKKSPKTKSKKVLVVPKGYHSITPYLIVNHAANAIEFYKKAFGAKELMRMAKEDGKIAHAELQIGDSRVMLADECHQMNAVGPQDCHRSPVGIQLYIKDVDAVVERAVAAGAKVTRAVENMFYGDRTGAVEDPFGHFWHVSTHVEDVTTAQIKKRMAAMTPHCETPKE